MALPIALQLYSVREEMEKDFKGTLERVKALGYDGVEFAGLLGHRAETVKGWCQELDLTPLSARVPFTDLLEDLSGVLEPYQTIGVEYISIGDLPEDRRPGAEGWLATVEAIKEIGKAVRERGMTLLYHNSDGDFTVVDGEYGLDMLCRLVSKEDLQPQLDICRLNVAGQRPDDYLRKYDGRIPVVLLTDYDGSAAENNFEFRPLGEGRLDLPLILTYCVFCKAQWVVVGQDAPGMGKTSMECAERSIQYLKTVEAKRW